MPSLTTQLAPGKYLRLVLGLTTGSLLAITLLAIYCLFFQQLFSYQALYAYQLEKLSRESGVKTVFVGDSSLGNSINADLFTKLSGKKTINLALTGRYGYAGSYNMLKKAVSNGRNTVEHVVVMHTANMMKRPVSYTGYLLTLGGISDILELSPDERGELIQAFYNFILSPDNLSAIIRSLLGSLKILHIENDFIAQVPAANPEYKRPAPIEPPPDERKARFLLKIIEYCNERGIDLIYTHGPLWRPVAEASTDYLAALNRQLSTYDMKLMGDVLFIEDTALGNSEDHVAPSFKDAYTNEYHRLLAPLLSPVPQRTRP